jgi:uncharacterized protein
MVPTLTIIFAAQPGFPPEQTLHMALGTSMVTILLISLASLWTHHQHGAVLWKVVRQITPGILLGTALGTLFALRGPTRPLALFFTASVCFVALQMILKPKPSRQLPGATGVFSADLGIGSMSAQVAIGGGAFTVPLQSWCNVHVQKAIGSSAAVAFPIALGGSLGDTYNGWGTPSYRPGA